jgi:hypothetical protein
VRWLAFEVAALCGQTRRFPDAMQRVADAHAVLAAIKETER